MCIPAKNGYYDLSVSMAYYQKALMLATNAENKAYIQSLMGRNMYLKTSLMFSPWDNRRDSVINKEINPFYAQLNKSFKKTAYYKEYLSNCDLYLQYIQHHQ